MTLLATLPAQALTATPPRGPAGAAGKAAPADAPRTGGDDSGFAAALDSACGQAGETATGVKAVVPCTDEGRDRTDVAGAAAPADSAKALKAAKAAEKTDLAETIEKADTAARNDAVELPTSVALPGSELAQWLPGWPPATLATPAATPAATPVAAPVAALTAAPPVGKIDGTAAEPAAALTTPTPVDTTSLPQGDGRAPAAAAATAPDEQQRPQPAHAAAVAVPRERAGADATATPADAAAPPRPSQAAAALQAGGERALEAPGSAPAWLAPAGLMPRDAGRPDRAAALADTVLQGHVGAALDSAGFAPALATQIRWLVREGVQHAQLTLNPQETGPLTVQIALDGSQARIDFSADLAATRAIIESSLPTLAAALHSAGLTLAGGGVFDGQARQGTRHEPAFAATHRAQDGEAGTGGEGSAVAARAPRGLVDLVA